ncbi:MAG: patatin-like phospholipase family protein [bacterium]|nr:patatin-like phospholipase family protein [bacterium]
MPLVIRAGRFAREYLANEGWRPEAFSTLVGASGGPKWLVLSRIDRALAEWLLPGRAVPLDLLGSSIGSFRHAAFSVREPGAAIARLERAYVEQRYDGPERPSQARVSGETARIVEQALGATGEAELLENRVLRNHVVTARWRPGRRGAGLAFRLALGASAAANVLSRRHLGAFFERVVFAPKEGAIRFDPLGFGRDRGHGSSERAARPVLTADNLQPALLASGSIPLLMEGVHDPGGAPPGLYLDGGILDYHFDFSFHTAPGLILFPHFFDRITPGWFDKPLRHRRPRLVDLDRVVMIAPSPEFVERLPGGKVPDRVDFERLPTDARQKRWWDVIDRCHELEAAVHELWAGKSTLEIRSFDG